MSASVTLHSSWRGILWSVLGAGAVFAAGLASVILTGAATASLILFVVGAVLLAVVLFDYPVAAEFDADGVTRRPLLRRHRIEWIRVVQLTRTRPGIAAAARNLKPGGLAVKVGRRRYLLVDQCESILEYDDLVELLSESDDQLGLDELIIPPVGVEPTFTYRRRKWQRQSDDV